jgi:mannose-6-phosphate isomerase-like protein (cupin superfamily)
VFFDVEEFPWHEPSGHVGGFSRYLVSPENVQSQYFDFRTSRYVAGGRVEPHVHAVAEHVYLILAGRGEAGCGEEVRVLVPGTGMFVPPGVVHYIANPGSEPLEFVVVTSPPSDIER